MNYSNPELKFAIMRELEKRAFLGKGVNLLARGAKALGGGVMKGAKSFGNSTNRLEKV